MYDQKNHHRFIELRAQGWSLARISKEMDISKSTLIQWQQRFHKEIEDLKKAALEELHEIHLPDHAEDLERLGLFALLIDDELEAKTFYDLSVQQLIRARKILRADVEKERAKLAAWQPSGKWDEEEKQPTPLPDVPTPLPKAA